MSQQHEETKHAPLPVAGYKPQSGENVALVNEGKELEERVLRWLDKIADKGGPGGYDLRMVALGKTNIQQGFMWSARSIFQPGRVKLPEDQA